MPSEPHLGLKTLSEGEEGLPGGSARQELARNWVTGLAGSLVQPLTNPEQKSLVNMHEPIGFHTFVSGPNQ